VNRKPIRFGLYGSNPYRTGALMDVSLELYPDNVDVVACLDINREAADVMAEKYEAKACYEEEVFLAHDMDVVLISLPPYLHPDAFVATCKAGKDVYLEKPVCIDQAGRKKVLEVAKSSKSQCYVGLSYRHINPFLKVAEIMKREDAGKLIGMYHHWITKTGPVDHSNWRNKLEQSGGQLVFHCCHLLDFFKWTGGPIVSITATQYTSDKMPYPHEEQELNAAFEFNNGGLAVLNLSQCTHRNVQFGTINMENLSIYYEWGKDTHVKVFKTRPRVPDEVYTWDVFDPNDEGGKGRNRRQMKEFLDAYLGDLPMPVGINDAIASFDIAMAVRESYKSGRKVIL